MRDRDVVLGIRELSWRLGRRALPARTLWPRPAGLARRKIAAGCSVRGGQMGSGALIRKAPGSLIGRDDDLEYITTFVDQAAVSGGALLLSGEAGVGKTVLLDAAAAHAEAAGSQVLRAAGAEFEGAVSFAGLNQLLRPLLSQARGLSAAYRRALAVALGVREGSSPDQLMLSNGAAGARRRTRQPLPDPQLPAAGASRGGVPAGHARRGAR